MKKLQKRQYLMFIAGTLSLIAGVSVLSFLIFQKINREWNRQKLLKENSVIEIPEIKIKAPILEGTDHEILSKAAGHFIDTGTVGSGNYCIAGHSSIIYKEYFNNLKKVDIGMTVYLYDKAKTCYTYIVTENFIVNPNETWILDDFGDNRITIITCTDDGTQRQVVVGMLNEN